MMKLLVEEPVANGSEKVIRLLMDPEFVSANMPFVVGRKEGKLVLSFRRMLVRFRDAYSLIVEGNPSEKRALHILAGEQSRIRIEYQGANGSIRAFGEYSGPRAWVVNRKLPEIASSLIRDADRAAEKARIGLGTGDYSEKLASLNWVTKLVMKSMLLRNEITMIPRGGLLDYIETLVAEKIPQRYPVVYVSGTSSNGSFRLLFVEGVLRGVYAVVEGKEYVGEEQALNRLEGATRVKVYGALAKPQEVLQA